MSCVIAPPSRGALFLFIEWGIYSSSRGPEARRRTGRRNYKSKVHNFGGSTNEKGTYLSNPTALDLEHADPGDNYACDGKRYYRSGFIFAYDNHKQQRGAVRPDQLPAARQRDQLHDKK